MTGTYTGYTPTGTVKVEFDVVPNFKKHVSLVTHQKCPIFYSGKIRPLKYTNQ